MWELRILVEGRIYQQKNPDRESLSTTTESTQTKERTTLERHEDQRDHATESHRSTTEVHSTKTAGKAEHRKSQKQTKRVT